MSSSTERRFARTATRIAERQDSRAERLADEVRDFVEPHGDERALDVGTGAGALALAFAPLVREVVGLDPVPELLDLGASALPNTQFVEGDGTALPFPTAPSTSQARSARFITSRSRSASWPSSRG